MQSDEAVQAQLSVKTQTRPPPLIVGFQAQDSPRLAPRGIDEQSSETREMAGKHPIRIASERAVIQPPPASRQRHRVSTSHKPTSHYRSGALPRSPFLDDFRATDHLGVGLFGQHNGGCGKQSCHRGVQYLSVLSLGPAFRVEDWYVRSGGKAIFCL
jgi:hypothetical protein